MTKRSEREWLSDIISWGERLQDHLLGVDRQAFFGSILIQDAACKCVEAIGEAAGKLDDLNPELDRNVPDLNLKLARKMRDRISHGYFQIDGNTLEYRNGLDPENHRRSAIPQTEIRRVIRSMG